MLTVENKHLFSTVKDEEIEVGPISTPTTSNSTSTPNHKNDSLFWCLYILHFGYNDYLQVSRNYGVRSLEVKKQVGEWLTKCPHALKQTNYKVTKASIQEIMSECITCQKETSMLTLLAILAHFKINIYLLDATERFLLELSGQVDDGPTFLIKKGGQFTYSIVGDCLSEDEKKAWKEKCVCLTHYEKPLLTISHYKVNDLLSIMQKLNMPIDAKKKKPELYLQLWNECLWK